MPDANVSVIHANFYSSISIFFTRLYGIVVLSEVGLRVWDGGAGEGVRRKPPEKNPAEISGILCKKKLDGTLQDDVWSSELCCH